MRRAVVGGVLLALAACRVAWACGYCVEDKIASTYDHAVVTAALGKKHHVAFYHLEGPLEPTTSTQRSLERLVESTPGVDKGTVRVAVETLTLSFAFDPQRASLIAVQTALERKLAARKLSLMPLRTIERPGELAAVKRRK